MGRWVVCSAWPYVNSVPHLGTLIGSVLSADVFARYLRMKGEDVIFVSGSDEHGTPIEVEAKKRNVEPKKLTDQVHEYVSKLFEAFEISFDNYTRTENPIHIKFVREFLLKVYNNGYIFTQEIRMPYCLKDKMFLPDRFIEGTCPYCGYERARGDQCDKCGRLLEPWQLINPKCVFCGSKPIFKLTKHWYFDLPKLTDALNKFIREHENFPDNAKKFSLNWIKEGLKPRAITRDNKWGIPAPFPDAENKTVYVWFDALLGYISATIEYGVKKGDEKFWEKYWKDSKTKTVYFIGKDNIPFHTIILPALILASGEKLVLPWQIAATEYLTFEGEKFSKSRGIGVWIDEALEMLDADYWRFALISMRPEVKDTNFTWKEFYRIVNSDLNDDIGNFIHRTLSFISKYFDQKVPKPGILSQVDYEFKEKILQTPDIVSKFFEEVRLKQALHHIIELARSGNQYLNRKAPWDKVKKAETLENAKTTLWLSANAVGFLALMLAPFIPKYAQKIWKMLGMETDVTREKWSLMRELFVKPGHKIRRPKPVFKKLPPDFLEKAEEILFRARATVKRPSVLK